MITENSPKISFGGANCYVIDCILDKSYRLVFIRLVGQDSMLRAISAAILQGKMKIKDNYLTFPNICGYVNLHKAGMRRIINPLKDAISQTIIYHREFLPSDNDMKLLWHTKNSAFESFKKFLENQPIPRLKSLENGNILEYQVFLRLKDMNIISELDVVVGNQKASFIDKKTLEADDFLVLRETILSVLYENSYKQKAA